MTRLWRNLQHGLARVRKAWALGAHIDDVYEAFAEREDGRQIKLGKYELELLENALAFGELTADDVGVPRAEIAAVPETASLAEVLAAYEDSGHSWLLVMGRDLDDVKGMLGLKDLLPLLTHGGTPNLVMSTLLRPVTFVPETMTMPRVLQLMKKNRVTVVVVTDEFGGVSGLISLKDILSELVGELADDNDAEAPAPLVPLASNRWRARGDATLEAVDTQLGTALQEQFGQAAETLSGALMQLARTIPSKGTVLQLGPQLQATVLASDNRRVLSVELLVQA